MSKEFWMVKGAGPSNVIHRSRQEAEQEAQRLARQHPGMSFFVMEAVTMYRKVDVERVDLRAAHLDPEDMIPF